MNSDARNLGALRFLVVEDNAFAAIVIRKTLNSLGIGNIDTATDGHQALELIDNPKTHPNVILLDIRMPGMGGVELLARLEDRQYQGQVILTSGVAEETLTSVEQLARDKGIHLLGILPKPLNAQALSKLLADASGE